MESVKSRKHCGCGHLVRTLLEVCKILGNAKCGLTEVIEIHYGSVLVVQFLKYAGTGCS